MRILQLMPQFPWPATDGGKIGIVNISREFSRQGHEVHVLAVSRDDISEARREMALADVAALSVVKADTRNSPANILRSLLAELPLFVWKFQRTEIREELGRICRSHQFDCIHADHSSMIPLALLARELTAAPVGLRLHNVEWVIWQRYAERLAGWRPEAWYAAWQARKLRRFESQHYQKMQVCFAITDSDRKRAQSMQPRGRYVIASAGVNLEEWQAEEGGRDPLQLALATTFNWVHNVEAVRWLLREVFPDVQRVAAGARLCIIGKNPPAWLQAQSSEHIEVTGFVDRVQPFLARAAVYCAPLFVGGGIRIKILEAMAMELPVVATSISAEGIGAGEEDGLFRADDPAAYGAALLRLLNDPPFARDRGRAARRYLAAHHTWERNVGIMLEEYRRLAANEGKS